MSCWRSPPAASTSPRMGRRKSHRWPPRELEEEAGLRAGEWRKLGAFYSAPGFTDELMHLYLATELTPASEDGRLGPDEDERLILEWRPWQEAVSLAETGAIRDAKSIVGLFWLARVMAESAPIATRSSGAWDPPTLRDGRGRRGRASNSGSARRRSAGACRPRPGGPGASGLWPSANARSGPRGRAPGAVRT